MIGDGAVVEGPIGPRRLVYADCTASGRAILAESRWRILKAGRLFVISHAHRIAHADLLASREPRYRAGARFTLGEQ